MLVTGSRIRAKVIGTFRKDSQGDFLPSTTDTPHYRQQMTKVAKISRLLEDTRRDADILKQSGNGRASGAAILISDQTFAETENVSKNTRLRYDASSGEVRSYSARILGPGEQIKLRYAARPLMLELNSSNQSSQAGLVTRRLRFAELVAKRVLDDLRGSGGPRGSQGVRGVQGGC